MDNQKIEHNLIIDQYTELKLLIPKQLTGAEFYALMTKAKKLLNLSEIDISEPTKRRNIVRNFYTSEKLEELARLVEEYARMGKTKSKAFHAFAKKYGKSKSGVQWQYSNRVQK